MTREEFDQFMDRARTSGWDNPAVRAEFEAMIVTLRAQGGRHAQLAEEFSAALRERDEEVMAIDAAYVIDIAKIQSTQNAQTPQEGGGLDEDDPGAALSEMRHRMDSANSATRALPPVRQAAQKRGAAARRRERACRARGERGHRGRRRRGPLRRLRLARAASRASSRRSRASARMTCCGCAPS